MLCVLQLEQSLDQLLVGGLQELGHRAGAEVAAPDGAFELLFQVHSHRCYSFEEELAPSYGEFKKDVTRPPARAGTRSEHDHRTLG
jgi:hypothetical protein